MDVGREEGPVRLGQDKKKWTPGLVEICPGDQSWVSLGSDWCLYVSASSISVHDVTPKEDEGNWVWSPEEAGE